jgi:hypothetical protein
MKRRRWPRLGHGSRLVAVALALAAAGGCSVGERDERGPAIEEETAAALPNEAGGSPGPACTPHVGGLTPADIPPLEIRCPPGFVLREARLSVPIAGRFRTLDELLEAYCAPDSDAVWSRSALGAPTMSAIDFETSDVVAHAYDALAGEPRLYQRGEDLWLRVESDSCKGQPPDLASIAFVVAKEKRITEQTCSRACN